MASRRKKTMQYDQKNLRSLEKNLLDIRKKMDNGKTLFRINLVNLEKVIQGLPKEDREQIEKFWGLTGGINHSKKIIVRWNDKALINMREATEKSLLKLFEIDRVFCYDENLRDMVEFISRKIDKSDIQISDLDAIKYIIAFSGILENGPKMSFDEDPLSINKSFKDDFTFDEYTVIYEAYREFQKLPDNYIKLKILVSWIEWLNFGDSITIKKTFGIELPNIDHLREAEKLLQQLPQFKGKEIFPTTRQIKEVEALRELRQVRSLKEKIFPYGAWETTSTLIFEYSNITGLSEFLKSLKTIGKDWSKIREFKTGEMEIRISSGIRNIDIYNIGGLKFTDPDEIRFLYTEGYYFFAQCNV